MKLSDSWPIHLVYLLRSLGVTAQCNNATTTLRNAADASSLATCTTYTGTIVMATDVPIPTASLEGVETLDGDLVAVNNSYLSTIVSTSLQSVTGSVILSNLPLLSNITLPVWQSVGTLDLSNIPQPATLNMETTQQQVSAVRVVNTTLEGLFGLSLRHAQMDSIYMVDNRYLQNLEFGVGNISQSAIFQNNGGGPVSLPNLTNAYTLQISNASGIDLPVLESVNQDLLLGWNTLSNISAPKLNFVGGDLDITNNAELTELDMNGLVAVQGSLRMTQNAILNNLIGLASLDYVGGMLDLIGAFTSASLPSLDNVEGAVIVQSANNTSVCSGIPAAKSNPSLSCPGTGSSAPSSKSGLSEGATIGIAVGVAVPCGLAIAAAIGVICVRRRRGKRIRVAGSDERDHSEVTQLRPVEMGSHTVWTKPKRHTKELAAEARPEELYTKANTHELRGDGRSLAEME